MQPADAHPDPDSAVAASSAPARPPVPSRPDTPASAARAVLGVGEPPAPKMEQANITIDRAYMQWLLRRAAIVVLVLAVAVASGVGVARNWQRMATWMRIGGVRPPEIYALGDVNPNIPCQLLTKDEIVAGVVNVSKHRVSLRDVHASLLHHLKYGGENGMPLQGICAQHLNRFRVCMCLVNMAEPEDAPDMLTMYNMRRSGASEEQVYSTEKSVLCEREVVEKRFQEITVTWTNERGVTRTREVGGMPAITIQQLRDVERGEGSCAGDSNTQAGIAGIANTLDDFAQNMLFSGDPDIIERITPAYAARLAKHIAGPPSRQIGN